MIIEKNERNHVLCAVIDSDENVITDSQSAVELLMNAKYEAGTKNMVE